MLEEQAGASVRRGPHLVLVGSTRGSLESIAGLDHKITVVLGPSGLRRLPERELPYDVLPVTDPGDTEAVICALLRARGDDPDVDAIAAAEEAAVLPAAFAAEILGARGSLSPVNAAMFRDKCLQKRAVRAAGIRTADFHILEAWLKDLPPVLSDSLPAVLKPVAGAAAADTSLITDPDAISEAMKGQQIGSTWLLESFVDGAEFHVDGVFSNGAVQLLTVTRYLINPLAARGGATISTMMMRPDRETGLYERAADLTNRVLVALGAPETVFHLECFDTSFGLVFGECAARPGGALVVEAVERRTGVNLHRAVAELAIGSWAAPPPDPTSAYIGMTFLALPPGEILDLPDESDLRSQPGVIYAVLERRTGELMPDMRRDSTARVGMVLVEDETQEAVRTQLGRLNRWFSRRAAVRPL